MADDTPPWFIKTTHTAPKPMSIHAFKMALLRKRLAVSASDEDAPMIKAELNAASNKRMQKELMEKYANAAEDAVETKEAAVQARERSEQLRREYKDGRMRFGRRGRASRRLERRRFRTGRLNAPSRNGSFRRASRRWKRSARRTCCL